MDSGCEKSEGSSVSMDPSFAAYLNNDFLSVNNEKTVPGVFLRRYDDYIDFFTSLYLNIDFLHLAHGVFFLLILCHLVDSVELKKRDKLPINIHHHPIRQRGFTSSMVWSAKFLGILLRYNFFCTL